MRMKDIVRKPENTILDTRVITYFVTKDYMLVLKHRLFIAREVSQSCVTEARFQCFFLCARQEVSMTSVNDEKEQTASSAKV